MCVFYFVFFFCLWLYCVLYLFCVLRCCRTVPCTGLPFALFRPYGKLINQIKSNAWVLHSGKMTKEASAQDGHQSLIIDASLEFKGDSWARYDHRFCQQAASNPQMSWSLMDSTLWSLAFTGCARTSRCCYYFSLTYRSSDCRLSPDPPTNSNQSSHKICFWWNESPNPQCTFPSCKFDHVYYICAWDPANTDINHKAIYCPQHTLATPRPIQPLFPVTDSQRLPTSRRC